MNVLAVGCHPDDLEIGCGGTLARLSRSGHQVTMCHVANGNKGHVAIPPDELARMRAAEAASAGALIQARVVNLGVADLEVRSESRDLLDHLVTLIREVRPDFIITHDPDDYMVDHREVSRAVFDASFSASVPYLLPAIPAYAAIVPIYYMDTLAGVNFLPTEYVDISDAIDVKLAMIDCHQTQITWLRDHDHIDFLEFVRTCSRFRGLQSGAKYAEGFRMCHTWPRMVTKRLLP